MARRFDAMVFVTCGHGQGGSKVKVGKECLDAMVFATYVDGQRELINEGLGGEKSEKENKKTNKNK